MRLIGFVSDNDLRALYSSCRAFIYPSIYEGFGLPPLEAMACGAPVVSSRVPSIKESVARIVSATDSKSLAKAIVELLTDEQARQSLSDPWPRIRAGVFLATNRGAHSRSLRAGAPLEAVAIFGRHDERPHHFRVNPVTEELQLTEPVVESVLVRIAPQIARYSMNTNTGSNSLS